jgi:Ca2+-binding EF-hand superfamily protein
VGLVGDKSELAELKKAFQEIDKNEDGYISFNEI